MNDVWTFLVTNGAVHTVVTFVIMTFLGWIVKLAHKMVSHQKELIEHQRETNDLLRTDTRGGNRDIVDAIQKVKDSKNSC